MFLYVATFIQYQLNSAQIPPKFFKVSDFFLDLPQMLANVEFIPINLIKFKAPTVELVSKELNHLAAILHVYAGDLNFMK